MLQVNWRQGGLDESGGQFATTAGLTEILLHPVKQLGVGVTWAGRPVEVNDAGTENTEYELEVLFSITFHVPWCRFMKV